MRASKLVVPFGRPLRQFVTHAASPAQSETHVSSAAQSASSPHAELSAQQLDVMHWTQPGEASVANRPHAGPMHEDSHVVDEQLSIASASPISFDGQAARHALHPAPGWHDEIHW
jgi:hypothetical protein